MSYSTNRTPKEFGWKLKNSGRVYLSVVLCVSTLVVALTAGCASTGPTASALSTDRLRALSLKIDAVLLAPKFSDASWSAHVIDSATKTTIYSRNADKNLVPASNVKLYTTAAALEHLGPDYTFETTLYLSGVVSGDTLVGDLVVRGSGDPTLSARYIDDPLAPLVTWADSLVEAGIRVVLGDVVGDDGLFTDPLLGSGWMWDDEDSYDSAQISALSILDNCALITVSPTHVGEPADVAWKPKTSYVTVINDSKTVNASSRGKNRLTRLRGTNDILVSSAVPMDTVYRDERITVDQPAAYFAHLLKEVLWERGVEVVGLPRSVDSILRKPDYTSTTMRRLASYTSPPLASIVRQVNKESENLDAELLLRAVGVDRKQRDSLEDGETQYGLLAIRETLARAGADTSRFTLVDGSGLSRYDLLSASVTAALLEYMLRHPDTVVSNAFFESLPVGGYDGTLKRRYPIPSRARGRVFAKTGTMTAISSLSGYVNSDSGRQFVFSLMSNNYSVPTDSIRAAQDAIVTLLTQL